MTECDEMNCHKTVDQNTSNNHEIRQKQVQDNKQSLDDSITSNKSSKRRRKQRRGRKRGKHSTNPYKLTNSEYEQKECERLQRSRDKMVEQGKTLAPFNTTQFIMAEHDRNEAPKIESINSSDLDTETSVEDNYLNNEFNEEYEIIKLDYYKKLNKNDLLNECFQILTELNKLQNTVLKLTKENETLKKQLNQNPSLQSNDVTEEKTSSLD